MVQHELHQFQCRRVEIPQCGKKHHCNASSCDRPRHFSRVAKGKFRVFLIYEFWAGPIQGAEPHINRIIIGTKAHTQHAITMGIALCMSVHNIKCCQDEYKDGDQIEDQGQDEI